MALFSRHPVDDDACFIIIDVSRYVNNEQVKKSPSKEMFTRRGLDRQVQQTCTAQQPPVYGRAPLAEEIASGGWLYY